MLKQKLFLALTLVMTTALTVLADGEQNQGNLTIIDYIYDSMGNLLRSIYG